MPTICPTCGVPVEGDAQFCPRDGTPLSGSVSGSVARSGSGLVVSDPLLGRLIGGRYRLTDRIGQGGMGTVYRAVHALMGKPVAVKVLRSDVAGDAEAAMRFHREARSASRLDHEHCIRVTDFGQSDDGLLYLVMELLDGESLGSLLSRAGALEPRAAATIALAVAQALGHAHEHGVIHRDLKPDNVFLCQRRGKYVVKVLDFGLAKIAGETSGQSITRAGVIFGTPEYMAPEQAQGLALDARSDLYSLGVMLYQMLVGDLPFRAPSFLALLSKQVQEPPQPPSQRRDGIPPELEEVVMRCLAKEPEGRFATSDALADALAPFAAASLASLSLPLASLPLASPSSGELATAATSGSGGSTPGDGHRAASSDRSGSGEPSGELLRASSSQGIAASLEAASGSASGSSLRAAGSSRGSLELAPVPVDTPSQMLGEFVPRRRLGRGLLVGVGMTMLLGGGVAAVLLARTSPPLLTPAAELRPPTVDPLVEARRLLDRGDLDGAQRILVAERARTDGLELQLLMGDLAEQSGNVLSAEAHFFHASKLAPQRAEPLARLASLLVLRGQREHACRFARAALARDARSSAARSAAAAAGCSPRP